LDAVIPTMDNEKVGNFLAEQREQASDDFLTFEDFWERKLWHELTDNLVAFYNEEQSAAQRIPIFENFVKAFADKINQLKLVKLGLSTAAQYEGEEHGFEWFLYNNQLT
jgi:26S proteasome regulatory subunit N9